MSHANAFDYPIPDLWVYLVIDPRGGRQTWSGLDRDRAHELARNTGCVVAKVPAVGDYRADEER